MTKPMTVTMVTAPMMKGANVARRDARQARPPRHVERRGSLIRGLPAFAVLGDRLGFLLRSGGRGRASVARNLGRSRAATGQEPAPQRGSLRDGLGRRKLKRVSIFVASGPR
jgi:hypothetical protein